MTVPTSPFPGRPIPPTTPETIEWWDATRSCRLLVQHCRECDLHQLYPRSLCRSCGSLELEFRDAAGTGIVYSHTTVEKSPDTTLFTPPYAVALVDLVEGPRLLTNVVGIEPTLIRCGDAVTVVWEPLPDGRQLPLFTPVS